MRALLIVAWLVAPVVLAADAEPLSPLARRFLHRRMERHGEDMLRLMKAVVLVEREGARAIANDIANEPRLARPMPDADAEINASLPSRFFTLQDELRERAKAVAAAAATRDTAELTRAFGRLTETCVTCHEAFRAPTR